VEILFWDINEDDRDKYQKRIIENNCKFIGGGTVDGTLMFIKSVGNTTNAKEKAGEIISTAFDGEKFNYLNSIKAGERDVAVANDEQTQSIGNNIMVVALSSNDDSHNNTLYKNWLLKFKSDGTIETILDPEDIKSGTKIKAVNVEYDYISILVKKDNPISGNPGFHFMSNHDTNENYDDYNDFKESQYVTEFLNDNQNIHQLKSFGVSFEKLFEQLSDNVGERLFIDFKTSERDD
jgi:hypothetical protein